MAILIRNGIIVTATDEFKGDILIKDEKITAIGRNLEEQAEETLDAQGSYIFPGGVDGHTHFSSTAFGTITPGFETTVAAAVGGTTTIVDFAAQREGMTLLDSAIKHREEEAEGKCAVDFALHAMVADVRETIFDEPESLVKAGISSIKLFMAYKGSPVYCDDATIFKMLQKAGKVGMLVMLHAENGDLIDALQKQFIADGKKEPRYHVASRPVVVEAEATSRAILLAGLAGAPVFIVHISCTEAMRAIIRGKQEGIAAFGETCPHYLILDEDNLSRPDFEGAKFVCSPALREAWHHDQLWRALQEGWLQAVGSDHSSWNFAGQKDMGKDDFTKIPNGMPGVENRLTLLYTYGVAAGKLSLSRMVDVFATAPAKFYGLYPQKGSIAIGSDADLIIFDPNYRGKISVKTSLQGIDYSPYEGFEQKGRPEKVFLRGNCIADNGKFVGKIGQGKFVMCEPYGLAYAARLEKDIIPVHY